jgi:hypothetical protein
MFADLYSRPQIKAFQAFLVGGAVAQMGERRVRNAEVRSSILLGSTNLSRKIKR